MKILHVYKNYYPVIGGIENHIKTLAEYQAKCGYEVTVLTNSIYRKTSIETINGVKVIKAAHILTLSRTPLSFSLLIRIYHLDTDITHLHFPYPWGEFAHLLLGQARSTVVTYHSDIIKQKFMLQFYKPFLFKVLAKADRIIATSPPYIKSSPYLQKISSKCRVIPLGIDIKRFDNSGSSSTDLIRGKYLDHNIILFVGRLRYFKGLQYLIDAMEYVDGKLLIIGTGPEERNLKKRVLNKGMGNKVVFLGDILDKDLPLYYNSCDLFVLPSSHRSEAFGTVLIEAMASGKPVISTELGTGTSYVNINGKTGVVVPARSSEALSRAIIQLCKNEGLRLSLGENAKERSRKFSKEIMVENVLQLYKELYNEKR